MKLYWLKEAFDDLERLFWFLFEKSPTSAEKAVQLIEEGSERLIEYPELGQPMDDNTERRELFLPFGAGAYVLRYQIREDSIVIIRVWHSREPRLH